MQFKLSSHRFQDLGTDRLPLFSFHEHLSTTTFSKFKFVNRAIMSAFNFPDTYDSSELETFIQQVNPDVLLKNRYVKSKMDEIGELKGQLVDMKIERDTFKRRYEELMEHSIRTGKQYKKTDANLPFRCGISEEPPICRRRIDAMSSVSDREDVSDFIEYPQAFLSNGSSQRSGSVSFKRSDSMSLLSLSPNPRIVEVQEDYPTNIFWDRKDAVVALVGNSSSRLPLDKILHDANGKLVPNTKDYRAEVKRIAKLSGIDFNVRLRNQDEDVLRGIYDQIENLYQPFRLCSDSWKVKAFMRDILDNSVDVRTRSSNKKKPVSVSNIVGSNDKIVF
jgi:hypothetical protein